MKLPGESFEFAKKHIENYYDSDFFPKPLEFRAIFSLWDEVKAYLCTNDVNTFIVECPLAYAVPKHSRGYRIAHQLDPMNSLIYTAFAHFIAEDVEKNRIPVDEKVACSYRINLDANGNFFAKGTGYNDFATKSLELAKTYNFVLQTDITDFYNQIYLHRLQNSIAICSPKLKVISGEIERFIIDINNKVSKGVPVGPAASIIMAEVLLSDIDQFILTKGYEYTRYVDDFRIFSNSNFDLKFLIHELTNYLYDNHRLTLEGSKTKIFETSKFIKNELLDPEAIEKEEVEKEINKLNLRVINFYSEFEDILSETEVSSDDKFKAQGEAFKKLMHEILSKDYFDLGLARHILRRSKKLRSRAIIPQLLDNLDYFAPAIRDVILYLDSVTNEKMIEMNKDRFIALLDKSEAIKFPYFKYWMEYYFSTHKGFFNYPKIRQFILTTTNIRNSALYAETSKSVYWVRQYKNKLFCLGAWEKRAIMLASKVLSKDERDNWMENVERNTNNFLDKVIAKFIRSLNE